MHWMIHLRKSWRKLCEDVPGLIRVIASPCRATVAFQHYLVRGHNMLGKGLDNDAKTFDVADSRRLSCQVFLFCFPALRIIMKFSALYGEHKM